jgi:hypothetical protein
MPSPARTRTMLSIGFGCVETGGGSTFNIRR